MGLINKKISITFIGFLFVIFSFAQENEINGVKVKDTVFVSYSKWPYFGPEIPPYIGINFGYEFITNSISIGLHHNIAALTLYGDLEKIAGYTGYSFYYRNFQSEYLKNAIESEIGIYTFIAFGINLNYNQFTYTSILGFKPFVGISLFHLQILYGRNIFKNSKDIYNELPNNSFTIRASIPIYKITRKKGRIHYRMEDESEW